MMLGYTFDKGIEFLDESANLSQLSRRNNQSVDTFVHLRSIDKRSETKASSGARELYTSQKYDLRFK